MSPATELNAAADAIREATEVEAGGAVEAGRLVPALAREGLSLLFTEFALALPLWAMVVLPSFSLTMVTSLSELSFLSPLEDVEGGLGAPNGEERISMALEGLCKAACRWPSGLTNGDSRPGRWLRSVEVLRGLPAMLLDSEDLTGERELSLLDDVEDPGEGEGKVPFR